MFHIMYLNSIGASNGEQECISLFWEYRCCEILFFFLLAYLQIRLVGRLQMLFVLFLTNSLVPAQQRHCSGSACQMKGHGLLEIFAIQPVCDIIPNVNHPLDAAAELAQTE